MIAHSLKRISANGVCFGSLPNAHQSKPIVLSKHSTQIGGKGRRNSLDGNAEIFEENYAIYQKVIYGEAVLCYCQALSRAAINPDAERMHSGVIPRHGARLSNGSSRRIQWCSESGGLILDQKNRVEGSCLGEKAEVG